MFDFKEILLGFRKPGLKMQAIILLIAGLAAICGCGVSKPFIYMRPKVNIDEVGKIGVLPFENFTSDKFAGEKMRGAIISGLLVRGVSIIEPGEITRILRVRKIRSLNSITAEDVRNICGDLKIDALITGAVSAYGREKGVSYPYHEVSIHLTMLEGEGGNIVWSVWQTVGGPSFWTRHFGAEGKTLTETARLAAIRAIDTLFDDSYFYR